MLTIWQYYVRVLVRLGSPDLAGHARHLVILAEIIARWPAAQRALNRRRDGVHGLELLAKAGDNWEWARALRALELHGVSHQKCAKGIRELLERYDGTRVAAPSFPPGVVGVFVTDDGNCERSIKCSVGRRVAVIATNRA